MERHAAALSTTSRLRGRLRRRRQHLFSCALRLRAEAGEQDRGERLYGERRRPRAPFARAVAAVVGEKSPRDVGELGVDQNELRADRTYVRGPVEDGVERQSRSRLIGLVQAETQVDFISVRAPGASSSAERQ